MTTRRENELPIALAVALVVHVLVFLVLAWLFSVEARMALQRMTSAAPEKEAVLLFPEQLMPVIVPPPPVVVPKPPPPPPPKSEIYIRTTQNAPQAAKPKDPAFISDRNTTAATKLDPSPKGDQPMPTTEGLQIQMKELANRDYRDGEVKEDSAPKQAASKAQQPAPASPPAPPPQPTAVITPPKPPTPPPAPTVAKTTTPDPSSLLKMMQETDDELAAQDQNRLKLEVKKAESPKMKEPDAPPPTPEPPKMRESTETVAKAIPVPDQPEVRQTPPRPADEKAFMPHTRTSEVKGTISNRGTEDSVDSEDSPKGRYIRAVQGQIEKKWNLYRVLRRDSVTYGQLSVVFYVNSRGKIEDLRVVNDRESNPMLSEFSLRAIRDAEIPPMPKDVQSLLPMHDKQRLKVEYNILIY